MDSKYRFWKDGREFDVEEWDAWSQWENLDWRDCDDDEAFLFQERGVDVIAFEDNVWQEVKPKGARRPDKKGKSNFKKVGTRLVIAEILDIGDNWVHMGVLRVDGYQAKEYRKQLEGRGLITKRKRHNLRSVRRLAWSDEEFRNSLVRDMDISYSPIKDVS